MDREYALRAAVKSVSDSVGQDGLVPAFLVYGSISQFDLSAHSPASTNVEQARAAAKAPGSLTKNFKQRQVEVALHSRNVPDVTNVQNISLDYHVLVYDSLGSMRDGAFPMIDHRNKIFTVLDTDGNIDFRIMVFKPYNFHNASSHFSKSNGHSPGKFLKLTFFDSSF